MANVQPQQYEVVVDLLGEAIAKNFKIFLKRFNPDKDPHQTTDTETLGASQYTDADGIKRSFFGRQVDEMRLKEVNTLTVDFQDVYNFNEELAMVIRDQYYRLEPFLRKVVQSFVRSVDESMVVSDTGKENEFYVSFVNIFNGAKPGDISAASLRDLKMSQVGRLTAFSGTVTRTSEVRPELFLGTFKCLECQQEIRGVPQQFKMTFPCICPNATCGNRKNWQLQREESVFVDWQKAKVQENPDEVPAGSMPRAVDIIIRANQVEQVRPGDRMMFSGCLITVPDISVLAGPGGKLEARPSNVQRGGTAGGAGEGVSGLKSLGVRELTYRTAFLVSSVRPHRGSKQDSVNIREDEDQSPEATLQALTDMQREAVRAMQNDSLLYDRMAESIAPGVFGNVDVKRSVLLQLLGGVHKKTPEGVSLRGDINVLIVGDPSCAKSQILKYVSKFLPRAIYTSGKASTAAGLTASVVKDPDSNEFCIEAGALLLADNGVCCIDEFDKMDVKDQVAIHEAMEQQTISIAKAGVQASLNARTSILAAANPGGGRYDKSKPLRYNVALPPAIMSRFDMVHIMIDEPNEAADEELAYHIVDLHRHKDLALAIPYTTEQLQCYIKYARAFKPLLSEQARKVLVQSYVRIRQQNDAPNQRASYRVTVRQLEAVVRLSEAIARLHCESVVKPTHVRAALRLVQTSMLEVELGNDAELDDPMNDFAGRADDEEEAAERANLEAGGEMAEPRATQADGAAAAPKQKQRQKIAASVYRRLRALICQKLDLDRVRIRELVDAELDKEISEEAAAAMAEVAAFAVPAEAGAAPAAVQDAAMDGDTQMDVDAQDRLDRQRAQARRREQARLQEVERRIEVLSAEESLRRGLTQADLVAWYSSYAVDVLKFPETRVIEEAAMIPAVIKHLRDREGIVEVLGSRAVDAAELEALDATERAMRLLDAQVLGLTDGYVPDFEH